ncbi:MAG: hypothetical protein ACREMK_07920 [Gemmatimonadota bacterium]
MRRAVFELPILAGAAVLLWVTPALAQAVPAGLAESRGDSLMQAFATAAAVDAYRSGLAGAPADPTLLWKSSRALLNLADERPGEDGDEESYREAVELARRAVEEAPDLARAHATLAAALGKLALFQGGKRKVELAREVQSEAELAVQLDASDFAAYVVLGILNRELATLNPFLKAFARTFFGRLPEASVENSAAYLERAVALAPDYVTPHVELALTYLEQDRDADAREELLRAIALPPREQADRLRQREARELLEEIED